MRKSEGFKAVVKKYYTYNLKSYLAIILLMRLVHINFIQSYI